MQHHSNQLKIIHQIIGGLLVLLTRAVKVLPPNFSPLGSFGFFGGNVLIYFLTIVVFDLLIGGLYSGFIFTYIGFAAYPALGFLARKIWSNNWKAQAILLPTASLLFFIWSNLGVWWFWYPRTLDGLLTCLLLALPFYQGTFLGDLLFGGIYMAWARRVKFIRIFRPATFPSFK